MKTLKGTFWFAVLVAWSVIEVFFILIKGDPSSVAHKILDKIQNSLWTKEEQLSLSISGVRKKYAAMFGYMDNMTFEHFLNLKRMESDEIEKLKDSYRTNP